MGKIGDLWVRLGLKKDEFTAGLDSAQKQTQTFSEKVKGYFSGVLSKTVALTAAFAAMGKGIAAVVRNVATFERANSELAAVLGTNLKGIEELSNSAKELGRTSEFTASEVTSLQVALARLGFDTGQIESMQKSILNFALAMGTDLGSAAEFTGSALRAFGLEADDTRALLDVMSASTTNSALNFSKLQTSISVVAPIAKAFGLSVQETAAFLGILANNGFDASSAATALRNILLNLADSNGKLAQGIGHSAKTFPEIIQAFAELRAKGIEVDEVLGMTDKRSAAAAAALISMGDDVADLKEKLDEAGGSLDTMATTMGDNVIGSVKALQSAWEGLTLAFEGSRGPMKWVVDRLTDILNRLTDILNGDKVSFWEALMGPIMGGAITGGNRRRRAAREQANAPATDTTIEPLGPNRPEGTVAKPHKLTDEELEELAKKRKKAYQELKEAAREAGEEAAAVAAADAEYAAREAELLKEFERVHELGPVPIFDNETLLALETGLQNAVAIGNELNAMSLQGNLDQQLEGIIDKLVQTREKSEELAKAISENLVSAIEDGLVGAFNALAEVLGGVTDGGMEQVAKALLEPLADMAIKAGTLIMMSGEAIEALKTSFVDFFGGKAIFAGLALVGVGIAAKAGLAALGNRGSNAGTVSSFASGGGDYTRAGGVSTAELTVNVVGTIKGSDIILSGANTLKDWNR